MNNAKIIADSLNVATHDRITTFLLPRFPKCLFAQLAKHGILSHNAPDEDNPGSGFSNSAASSRAIPTKKLVEKVLADPYVPIWTKNQKGMVGVPLEDPETISKLSNLWLNRLHDTCEYVGRMSDLQVHKQDLNRLLEPWLRMPVLLTATAWKNFFNLRAQTEKPIGEAQPAFRETALEMHYWLQEHQPKVLQPGEWHLPFGDKLHSGSSFPDKIKVCCARSARLSYFSHDGEFSLAKDLGLYDRLVAQGHMEPLQHASMAVTSRSQDVQSDSVSLGDDPLEIYHSRNYRGFISHRAMLEQGIKLHEEICNG